MIENSPSPRAESDPAPDSERDQLSPGPDSEPTIFTILPSLAPHSNSVTESRSGPHFMEVRIPIHQTSNESIKYFRVREQNCIWLGFEKVFSLILNAVWEFCETNQIKLTNGIWSFSARNFQTWWDVLTVIGCSLQQIFIVIFCSDTIFCFRDYKAILDQEQQHCQWIIRRQWSVPAFASHPNPLPVNTSVPSLHFGRD